MSNENIDDDLFEDVVEESGSDVDLEIPEGTAAVHEDLLEQVKNAEGRALRAQAELENFRQRAKRELDDSLKFANQSLLADLLPVIDNVYREIELFRHVPVKFAVTHRQYAASSISST